MNRSITTFTAVLCLVAGDISARDARAQAGKTESKPQIVQRFPMNPVHVNVAKIAGVKPDGTVNVHNVSNPSFFLHRRVSGKTDLTEGRYLGFVGKDFVETTKDLRLVKLQVVEVRAGNKAVIRVSAAAAKQIKPGEDLLFFRPPGSTTKQLQSAPDYAPVDDGEETSVLRQGATFSFRDLSRSKNNLKQLGIAMHNFHDVHGTFPPAVVYGPDGKPWHSWRVLILPYIEQNPLYDQYRFDEPWNGPNNKKLLKHMPPVYRDPVYGEEDGNYYTHYAAVTGEGTIFPSQGIRMGKKSDHPLAALQKARGKGASRIRDIVDGTSNTVLVGSVGPQRKIPWMKPEDVSFKKNDFPAIGKTGSFAAPYRRGGKASGVFLFADGHVTTLNSTLDDETLRRIMQRNDRQPVGVLGDQRPRPRQRTGPRAMQFVEIFKTDAGYTARLSSGDDPR